MQHITVLLTIIILLVIGFFTLTAVIVLMTEDPTKSNENSRIELIKEHRKQFYKLENSGEVYSPPHKSYSLRPSMTNARTRLTTTVATTFSTSTLPDLITMPTTTKEYQTEATTHFSSKKPFRVSPVTVKVNHTIFHGLERMETEKSEIKEEVDVEIAQLHLTREIRAPSNDKISTLMIKNSYLYLPLTTGDILVYNLSNYDLVTTFKTSLSFYRIGFLGQNIVATEIRKNTLSILDEQGRVAKQLKMLYDSKDMQIYEDQVYVLSRSNQDIFVYDKDLILKNTIHFKNENQETCNVILPTSNGIYVSCQSSILQLESSGKIIKKLKAPGGSYSLGIGLFKETLFAAKRGEQEIHAFDQETGEYKIKLVNSGRGSAIWSCLAFDGNYLFALEYMQNIVKVFLLP
uniref:Uncharacterized protein n=1 Tax=Panagrolaimus superbus TaxID=310955 RepID=A0A914Z7N0_9BILA